MYPEADQIKQIIDSAQKIVIVQADNPDADSLGSALALEHILGDLGKEPYLYCAVDMPGYLHYLLGWDRVEKDLPKQFEAGIIVDASTTTLLEKMNAAGQQSWLAAKPCIVLDHHEVVDQPISFAQVTINEATRASTGELIYMLAKQLSWDVSKAAQELLMTSILGDTQGLSNSLATPETYRIMAEFVENGVDRPALEEQRREFSKMAQKIYSYKAELIKRTGFSSGGRVAAVTIPQREINEFSPLYNPAPLIQGDMLNTTGVSVSIVMKQYDDGHMTGAIRCNNGAPIAAQLAERFGGGGHTLAAGFKIDNAKPFDETVRKCLDTANELLDTLDNSHETV